MSKTNKEVRICSQHEEKVRLIFTFAFDGSEYWCPYCGATYGLLGAGVKVAETPELNQSFKDWKKKTRKFLSAKSMLSCDSMLIKGKWVNREEIPASMINRAKKIVDDFKYEIIK